MPAAITKGLIDGGSLIDGGVRFIDVGEAIRKDLIDAASLIDGEVDTC